MNARARFEEAIRQIPEIRRAYAMWKASEGMGSSETFRAALLPYPDLQKIWLEAVNEMVVAALHDEDEPVPPSTRRVQT